MKLTVLVDNHTYIDRYYLGEPAACYLIEDGERTVLFDTGYSDIFIENARRMGIEDLNRIYTMHDMAHGNVMFAATGVTDGAMLRGVRRFHGGAETHSLIMRAKTGTVRLVTAEHNFGRKTWVDRS